jgi:hypothetical protein
MGTKMRPFRNRSRLVIFHCGKDQIDPAAPQHFLARAWARCQASAILSSSLPAWVHFIGGIRTCRDALLSPRCLRLTTAAQLAQRQRVQQD